MELFIVMSMLIFLLYYESMADNDDQPVYSQIVYGGTIRHVTLSPSDEYDVDFFLMKESLIEFVQNHHPLDLLHEQNINCYAKLNLWYTRSDELPLVYTNYVSGPKKEQYPTCVPVSMGSTYSCEVRLIGKQSDLLLFITLTKEFWDDQFYVYSHIFFPFSKSFGGAYAKNGACENFEMPKNLFILSSLSKTKAQRNCLSNVESELQARVKHVLPYSEMSRRLQSSSNGSSSIKNESSFKTMTYNIWNFNPYFDTQAYLQRIKNLLQIIKKADPDIIGFQEVRFQTSLGGKQGPSQLDHLTSFLKDYQYVFQPAQMQENSIAEGRTEEGLAIFSKYPIIYHDYLLLFRNKSNMADGHQRICLHAVIAVPLVGQVHVFNTHLSLSHEAREESSSQILKFMALYEGPAVLLGDLNAVPDENAIQMLLNNTELLDSWTLLHGTEPGFTFNTLEAELSKRIDYILIRKGVKVLNMDVQPDKSRSKFGSDHRALQATLLFNKCH